MSRELDAFKARPAAILSDKQSEPLVGKLIQAAELAARSENTWARAPGVQHTVQRDTILREVSVQWQGFQNLVRETRN